jgi:hypothetical protein
VKEGHFYEAKWLRKFFVSVPRVCRGDADPLWSMRDQFVELVLQNKGLSMVRWRNMPSLLADLAGVIRKTSILANERMGFVDSPTTAFSAHDLYFVI